MLEAEVRGRIDGDEAQLLFADLGGVFVEPTRTDELWSRGKDDEGGGDMGDGGYIVRNKYTHIICL